MGPKGQSQSMRIREEMRRLNVVVERTGAKLSKREAPVQPCSALQKAWVV